MLFYDITVIFYVFIFLFLSFSLFFTHSLSLLNYADISLVEEWPSRGKTLEGYDGSSSHCCCPVACPQSLMDPPTSPAPDLTYTHKPLLICTSLNTGTKSHPTFFPFLSLLLCVHRWTVSITFLYPVLILFATAKIHNISFC